MQAERAGCSDDCAAAARSSPSQAGDKARGLVGQGLERASEALANVGADGRRHCAAASMSGSATNMAIMRAALPARSRMPPTASPSKDPDELIDDTRNFVRNSPGMALAGAAVVGFVVARLVKSGLADASRER